MSNFYSLIKNHTESISIRLIKSRSKKIYNLSLAHMALFLAIRQKSFIVIEDSPENACNLYQDFIFFKELLSATNLSSSDLMPLYLPLASPETSSERAKLILDLTTLKKVGLITVKDALKTGFEVGSLRKQILQLKKGMEIQRDYLEERLITLGYKKTSLVIEKNEFAVREWIFDFYPSNQINPLRIEFFGDKIELIRTFDIATQRSINETESLTVFPSGENKLENELLENLERRKIYELFDCSNGKYINDSVSHITKISHLPFDNGGIDGLEIPIHGLGILTQERQSFEDIALNIIKTAKPCLIVLQSSAQAERLKDIFLYNNIIPAIIEKSQVPYYKGNICITIGNLSSGLNLPSLLILSSKEIFGERTIQKQIGKTKKFLISNLMLNINDLSEGDFVVHKKYGIGRFIGLGRKKAGDFEEDLIAIEYANNDRLYVPFYNINNLNKYSAKEGHTPQLDKLGGKKWLTTKKKAKQSAKEMAENLISLYAERKILKGFTFSEDTILHKEFDDFFPFEETQDQIIAIEEIKKLMQSEEPMDLLLCGDVGYGKTEVAMKAAFRAVYDGKQVVIICPTTLLVEQHYRIFKERFSGFPLIIDYLSRFKSKSDIKKTIDLLKQGTIEIIIGTHILLNKKIEFYDLGLIIIDEEHRFGVSQKEKLKELKKGIDVLALTATPIPRTLQMALSNIRSLFIIETPPEERLSVKNIIVKFNKNIIKEAIKREIDRGGQVFFVHNKIHNINKIYNNIKNIVPNANIVVAHGQMPEDMLERTMTDFLHKKINVLICTSIISSGLDIQSANTIIINNADTFGLADLYQLRGRIGRSNVQGFAYFLTKGENFITDNAKKRLMAIQEMGYLGAGFRVALKDLEIRGAGNLLGKEQSGYIYKVGFDMYMELLEQAVREFKGESIKEDVETEIKFKHKTFIPQNYISDINLRLIIYKRLSSVKTIDKISDFSDEIIDRFGEMPVEVKNLLCIIRLKLLAKKLFISKILETENKFQFLIYQGRGQDSESQTKFLAQILNVLTALSKDKRNEFKINFLQNGFELDCKYLPKEKSLDKVEQILKILISNPDIENSKMLSNTVSISHITF